MNVNVRQHLAYLAQTRILPINLQRKSPHWSSDVLVDGSVLGRWQKSIKAQANIGIFPWIFLGIILENGASWLERWMFLRVSGISLRFSWIYLKPASSIF